MGLLYVVWWSDYWLMRGCRVLLYCKHGFRRTGVAIYLLLRSILETPTECVSLMKKMLPDMHFRGCELRKLLEKADAIFARVTFQSGIGCMTRWS
jgi:hypothetical protein